MTGVQSKLEIHSSTSTPEAPVVSITAMGWYTVAVMTLINAINFADRLALSMLMPAVRADLKLSDSQLGLLVGLGFSLLYAAGGIPFGRIADRRSRKVLLGGCLFLWSIATAVSGAAQGFWHLLLARMAVGAGESANNPAAQSLICDAVPPSRRPAAFTIFMLGGTAGTAIALTAAGHLVDSIGWRWTFAVFGMPGILLALLVLFTVREPVRGIFDETRSTEALSFTQAYRSLAGNRVYRLVVLITILSAFCINSFMQWLPTFWERSYGIKLSEIGMLWGTGSGIAGVVGLVGGGWMANRLSKQTLAPALLWSGVFTGAAGCIALVALHVSSAQLSIGLCCVAVAAWSVAGASTISALHAGLTSDVRASGVGLLGVFGAILGIGLGPFVIGVLSDAFSGQLALALTVPALLFLPKAYMMIKLSNHLKLDETT